MGLFPPQTPGPVFLAWSKKTGQKDQEKLSAMLIFLGITIHIIFPAIIRCVYIAMSKKFFSNNQKFM